MNTYNHPHFSQTHIPKGTDAYREVWEPDDEARTANRTIVGKLYRSIGLQALQEDVPYVYATGGYPGRTIASNIRPHADNYYFFLTDLSHAYDSVKPERLAIKLSDMELFTDAQKASEFLEQYCVHPRGEGLLQGAPAAPALFNVYCTELDLEIAELSKHFGLTYTRYLDDITLSAPREDGPIGKHKRRAIFKTIKEDGWEVADHKTRIETLSRPITITGLSLYPSGHWKISPKLIGKIKNAFNAVATKIDSGQPITRHDIGVLDGYHGTITSGYDDRRGQPTPIETDLLERYYILRAEASMLLGGIAVQ